MILRVTISRQLWKERRSMRAEIVRQIQKRLRRWRAEAMKKEELTQEAFAARAHIGISTIKGLLSGPPEKFNPELDSLSRYLEACGKNLGELFDFLNLSVDDDVRQLIVKARNHPLLRPHYNALLEAAKAIDE